MSTVFYCSPYNSTHFTTCCKVAICSDQQKCPKCGEYVYPFYEGMTEDDKKEYTGYFGHGANIARNAAARRRGYS